MPTVRIVQLQLCPERHCVIGLAYVSDDGTADPSMSADLKRQFDLSVKLHIMNPYCGICHSLDLHTEDGATIFASIEEALPVLQAWQVYHEGESISSNAHHRRTAGQEVREGLVE